MAQNSSKNGSNRYARAQPSSEKSSRPAFMSGLVIGALIMYFFPLINESSPSETAATVNELVKKADLKELKFDFYKVHSLIFSELTLYLQRSHEGPVRR